MSKEKGTGGREACPEEPVQVGVAGAQPYRGVKKTSGGGGEPVALALRENTLWPHFPPLLFTITLYQ